MKKFFSFTMLAIAFFGFASFASAQDLLTYNLRMGMKGDAQVAIMQNLLISQNYLPAGNSTGNFGPLTFKAVKLFQGENSIDTTGFVGPKTRGIMNTLISGGTVVGATYQPGCSSFVGFSATTGLSCVPQVVAPVTVTPVQVSNVTSNGANLSSSFTATTSGYYTVRFEYATDPNTFSYGTQARIGQIILSGQAGSFSASMTNLQNLQTYYVRAVVEGGSQGAVTSSVASFTVGGSYNANTTVTGTYQNQSTAMTGQALVGTNAATSVTDSSALLSGVYDGRGTPASVSFQYWYGNSGITSTNQVQGGSGAGSASLTLSNLTPNMTYSYRMVVSNSYGTVYGSTMSFTTTQTQSQNNGGGYIYYGGSTNTCAGALPNVTASLDSTSPTASVTVNQVGASFIVAKISTDCDASLKSLTFTANPIALLSTFSNFKVYLNGSSTPLAGSFSGTTFTLTTPVLLNAGTYSKIALKGNTAATGSGSFSFGLSNVVAASSAGVVNQYPVNVTGNTLSYSYTIYQNPGGPINSGVVISGTSTGTIQGNTNTGLIVQ